MLPDRMFSTFQTAAGGLSVQREKISVAARNIANAQTSAPNGSADVYRPQSVKTANPSHSSFSRVLLESVTSLKTTRPDHIQPSGGSLDGTGRAGDLGPSFEITEQDHFRYEYDPNHPDADENGMVRYPDVDLIREMTQLVSATRLYEANLSSIEAEKEMIKRSLEI